MQPIRELLTAVYAAFNRRDIEGALALMRPDVDWPNGMEGGRVHGCDEVRDYWKRQWGILDPHVEPVHIEDDGAQIVVDGPPGRSRSVWKHSQGPDRAACVFLPGRPY